jgi:exopolysaccharide biosynthesis operon protein EpsL
MSCEDARVKPAKPGLCSTLPACVAAMACALAAQAAVAQAPGGGATAGAESPVRFVVGADVTWDDNLFRTPDTQPLQAERTTTAYVGLRIDKPYGQQRFLLNVTEAAYRYQNQSYLDFDALSYAGEWQWRVSPRVSGTLSADRSENLVSYADVQNTSQRNLRIFENQRFSADGWLTGGWHLLATAFRQDQRDTVPSTLQSSFQATGGEGGVRYDFGSGSTLAFVLRSVDGEYTDQVVDPVNLIDDGYRRDEAEVQATWAASAKTAWRGRLARVDYRSDEFVQRDFSGTTGDLGLLWSPTATLKVGATATRLLEAWRDSTASYRAANRLLLAPVWQVGARTTLRMGFDYATYEYLNPVVATTAPLRQDKVQGLTLAADWAPTRNSLISASVLLEHRDSNDATYDYKATVGRLGASLAF